MDTYSWMREFADSWALLALFLFFIGVIFWAFRPGSRETHRDAGSIPFRNDTISAHDDASGDAGTDDTLKMGGAS